MQYFLYARKSTEDEERQIMSIEAQLAELAEYAKRENVEIAQTFIESKSAKKPGREIFNEMMTAVQESTEPVGLLAWHPDRLARNSVDGGLIIYSIDTQKITSLRFPTFWFEPTPQGLFMLQVAFGQSKYYSDNLSENVKRGIRQKLRRGEWPTLAPFGYTNNPKTRNIEPDPMKARVIQKAFEEYADGKHTLETLSARLSFWGVVSGTGKPLTKSMLHRVLQNPAYIGIIKHNGESYQGGFPPIVSPATFERVQEVLTNRAKPRKSKQRHYFPFTGLFRCGECGAAITAQYAHGHGGTYKYYRCTKRLGPCSQKYIQEQELIRQLKTKISNVTLCETWKEKMLAQVEIWKQENHQASHSFAQNLEEETLQTEQKLDRLVNAFLDGTIEKETYLVKKEELIKTKTDLRLRKSDFGRRGNNWIEPLRDWILTAFSAEKLASSNDLDRIKSFAGKIGTNRQLLDQTVMWNWIDPWRILVEYRDSLAPVSGSRESIDSVSNGECFTWSGCWELNPVYLLPKQTYYRYTTAREQRKSENRSSVVF